VSQFAGIMHLNLQQTRLGKQIKAWGSASDFGQPASVPQAADPEDGLGGYGACRCRPAARGGER
jgi:hypothetical protein